MIEPANNSRAPSADSRAHRLRRRLPSLYAVFLCAALAVACAALEENRAYDIVIQHGRVMDPQSGLDAVRDVGIREGRIVALSTRPLKGLRTIDAAGHVVTAGFIDLHAHGQHEEAFRLMVRDGVTTALELEVGTLDPAAWYAARESGQLVNYGVSVGHIPIRMQVMGDSGAFLPVDRAAKQAAAAEQISAMAELIEKGLQQGALAVGFGMAYTPAATTAEFERMLRIVAAHGTTAHIHVKDGLEGLEEAIACAAVTHAALHVVHANSSGAAQTAEFLQLIEQARRRGQDVTTEAYPYEAGMTSIESARFDDWQTWDDARFAMHEWPATGERLTRESFARYRSVGGPVIRHTRTEEMTLMAIASPLTMIASDGSIEHGKGHPRTAGTYSKVLAKYVREQHALTLMQALRKMTIDPARRLEPYVPLMRRKGRISVGADADIVVFDPAAVVDRATYANPALAAEGIPYVLVNGVLVVDQGVVVEGVRPGRAVRR